MADVVRAEVREVVDYPGCGAFSPALAGTPAPAASATSGLYDPAYEHDACGIAFVACLDGRPSHETVRRALRALANLEHRGASGADADTGDGAGILLQLPHRLFGHEPGSYGAGCVFLPPDARRRRELEQLLEAAVRDEGQRLLGWRNVPVDLAQAGSAAAAVAPVIRQLLVGAASGLEGDAFERKLYVIRRVAELAAGPDLVVPSLSSRTLVYKGMLTAPQLERFYLDLADERV
ncbi:MAG TPA: hypothetical protein VFL60_05070, partial [Gaiellaceae bacterium]|nr:hypothetical protein [Gaiellaceae bacterium]